MAPELFGMTIIGGNDNNSEVPTYNVLKCILDFDRPEKKLYSRTDANADTFLQWAVSSWSLIFCCDVVTSAVGQN